MVYFDGRKWQLCTEKVHYTDGKETRTQFVGSEGHDWWVDMAKRWQNITVHEFLPVRASADQLERYQDILALSLPDGWRGTLSEYVEHGTYDEDGQKVLRPALDAKTIRDLTAQVQALTVIASKQVDDLELTAEEREQVGRFIELKEPPGKEPGIGRN